MKIGIIAGMFEIIHPGYIKAFKEAKLHCDRLVVCVQVQKPDKPMAVLSVSERIETLEAIRYVDDVVPYNSEEDFCNLLRVLNPDIRFLGSDYDIGIKAITGRELNIPIHFLDRSHGWSATKFRECILQQAKETAE